MNRKALFFVSCLSLVTTSMVFSIRGDIEANMSAAFHLSKEQMGLIWGPSFWGFTIAIFLCGLLVDILGMKVLHALSSLGYLAGVSLVLTAPPPTVEHVDSIFAHTGTTMLYIGFLLMGLSQGIVEGVINPLVATMYSDNKIHKLNLLHAWWPGGIMIGGLAAYFMTESGITDWKIKLSLIMIPAALYLVGCLTQKYPKTERVASGVSTATMISQVFRPLFIVLFLCMWLTTASELGPDQWVPSLLTDLTSTSGILILVYTAGLMFILRNFAGPLAHRLSPVMLLIICSVLTAAGLFGLGSLTKSSGAVMVFAAATIFAMGKAFFWPTMLGIVSEQYPRGGSLLMNLMGGAGMLAVGLVLPEMGKIYDKQGAAATFKGVAILPVILVVVFSLIALYFKSQGGYRQVKLEAAPAPGAA